MAKKQTMENIPISERNKIFEGVIMLYDYVEDMIEVIQSEDNTQLRNRCIVAVDDLIDGVDSAAKTVSTEYFDIIKKDNITKNSSEKIMQALQTIEKIVQNAKKSLMDI